MFVKNFFATTICSFNFLQIFSTFFLIQLGEQIYKVGSQCDTKELAPAPELLTFLTGIWLCIALFPQYFFARKSSPNNGCPGFSTFLTPRFAASHIQYRNFLCLVLSLRVGNNKNCGLSYEMFEIREIDPFWR